MASHLSLSDRKSPQVCRTLLSIIAGFSNATVFRGSWLLPTSPIPLVSSSNTIIITIIFHSLFSSLATYYYYYHYFISSKFLTARLAGIWLTASVLRSPRLSQISCSATLFSWLSVTVPSALTIIGVTVIFIYHSSLIQAFVYLFTFIFTLSYLPTPPLGQDMTQGQYLSGVKQVLIQSFPSPRLVA